MSIFATEFPLKGENDRGVFLAELIGWLRGIKNSSILRQTSERDLGGENVQLRSESGEDLRIRELKHEDLFTAIGFRHELPDDEGRVWRTEGVLRANSDNLDQSLLRIRTQCLAGSAGVDLRIPRKPYLIKEIIRNGHAGKDLDLEVRDEPLWLENTDRDLEIAKKVTLGSASRWLPIVYISADNDGKWPLERKVIEKLSFDLGGIAHVVVEPNRAFSVRLRDECNARNAYGGAIGLTLPGPGIVRRSYAGGRITNSNELVYNIRDAAILLRSQMPSFGWDWTDLQERALRVQRDRFKHSLSPQEIDSLLDDLSRQIDDLAEENLKLKADASRTPTKDVILDDAQVQHLNSWGQVCSEIYEGEIADRLRYSAKTTLAYAELTGLDGRTKYILQEIAGKTQKNQGLVDLMHEIERATKDPKRMAGEVRTLLKKHGYREKSENKHVRFEPEKEFPGLDSITVAKTPSDFRAPKNTKKQICHALGISKLDD